MKKSSSIYKLRAGDLLAAAVLLTAAVLLLILTFRSAPADTVLVTTEAETLSFPLAENRTCIVHSGGFALLLSIENGSVRVTESNCPGNDCVHTGSISHSGKSIVCLPAQVIIKITGEDTENADWILP